MTTYADAMRIATSKFLIDKLRKQCKYSAGYDGSTQQYYCTRGWFMINGQPLAPNLLPCNPLCCPMDIERHD